MNDVDKLSGVAMYALDERSAKDLWTLSEKLTNTEFKIEP